MLATFQCTNNSVYFGVVAKFDFSKVLNECNRERVSYAERLNPRTRYSLLTYTCTHSFIEFDMLKGCEIAVKKFKHGCLW